MSLPIPSITAITPLILSLQMTGPLRLGMEQYNEALDWVEYLAHERPDIARIFLRIVPIKSESRASWCAHVTERIAAVGRITLLMERLYAFHAQADIPYQIQKIWRWLENPNFGIPRIAKWLIYHALVLVNHRKQMDADSVEIRTLLRLLMKSRVMIRTIPTIAPWFCKRLEESVLLSWCFGRKQRTHPVISAEIRATARAQSILRQQTLYATVRLVQFFTHLQKPTRVLKGDCCICWRTRILVPLHGEDRHTVCGSCKGKLLKTGKPCPICREQLRNRQHY